MERTLRNARTIALACLVTCVLCADLVRADQSQTQRAAARELGTLGMQAYFDKDYKGAAEHLDMAYRLFSTPTLGLWSARAWIQLGQWLRAAERLRETQLVSADVGDNSAQLRAQADATEELHNLELRIPRLTFAFEDAPSSEVRVSLDGRPIPHELLEGGCAVDPGEHNLVGVSEDQRVELTINVQENETRLAHLTFRPAAPPTLTLAPSISIKQPQLAPAPKPYPIRPVAIATLSLAGASLAASGVVAWLASNKLGECVKRAGQFYCGDREADAYEAYRGVASATFYSGTALAGVGLLLWLLQPQAAERPNQLSVSPNSRGAKLSLKF